MRGARYDYVNVQTQSWRALQLVSTASSSRTAGSLIGSGYAQEWRAGMLELAYEGRYSLAYSALSRRRGTNGEMGAESQRGLLGRAERRVGLMRLWGTAEAGRAADSLNASSHAYHQLSLGGSVPLGPHMISVYGETSEGAAVMRGASRMRTLGFDAQLVLTPTTTFAVDGSDTRTVTPNGGFTYMDARLTHMLPTGASVSMRVRVGGRDIREAALGQKQAYLEYSMPLRLPIGPTRTAGRVHGRVVDQQTGQGVAGALVRLGPQAAITDDAGRVSFAGVPAGAYRIALGQQLASGSSVFNGDPNVEVDSLRRDPVTFNVAVERAGTVSGSVRRMIVARTGLGASPDSLVDGGPMEGVSIALAGARDTVYRITDAAGTFHFTDVPSGTWTVIVMEATAAQMQWEIEQIPIVMRAGDKPVVAFRLVPKRRKVRIVSGDGIDENGRPQ
jgi:hypothetical protein